MGSGIAEVAAARGFDVIVREVDQASADKGRGRIEKSLGRAVSKEKISAEDRDAADRRAGRIGDLIWLVEHPPVYTTGRHGERADLYLSDESLAARGAEFVVTDRGGQMTWHGPGQTTGYVIADVRRHGVRRFVLAQLEAMADAAGVAEAMVDPERMGVYVAGRKLGSVGIRVARGVAYHGLALNRDPDLEWFSLMSACGAPDVAATSIAAEGGDPDRERVEARLADALAAQLGIELVPGAAAALGAMAAADVRAR